jgi:two-component system, sensor histidine kinase and response regulator
MTAVDTVRPLRVLVAEDSPINQRLMRTLLGHRGHHVVIAADGQEALAALAREPFDVALMDLHMSGVGGLEATAAIRERERATGGHLPIVALTGSAQSGDRERCLAAGMDGYVLKPFNAAELIELIESLATAGGSPASPEDPRREPEGSDAGAGAEIVPWFDVSAFLADAALLAAEIGIAIARRDGPALEGSAHRLVGSAGWFQAGAVVAWAQRLEELGKAGEFTARTESAHQNLAAELDRLAVSRT